MWNVKSILWLATRTTAAESEGTGRHSAAASAAAAAKVSQSADHCAAAALLAW